MPAPADLDVMAALAQRYDADPEGARRHVERARAREAVAEAMVEELARKREPRVPDAEAAAALSAAVVKKPVRDRVSEAAAQLPVVIQL